MTIMTHWEKILKHFLPGPKHPGCLGFAYLLMWEEDLIFFITTHLMTVPLQAVCVSGLLGIWRIQYINLDSSWLLREKRDHVFPPRVQFPLQSSTAGACIQGWYFFFFIRRRLAIPDQRRITLKL